VKEDIMFDFFEEEFSTPRASYFTQVNNFEKSDILEIDNLPPPARKTL